MTGLEIILAASLTLLAVGFVIHISYKDTSSTDLKYTGPNASNKGGIIEEDKLPDISEPVISFVRIVKEDPKRFSIKVNAQRSCYVFTDKKLGRSWDFSYYWSTYSCELAVEGVSWLSVDEKFFILNSLVPVFERGRKESLCDLQRLRMKRLYS